MGARLQMFCRAIRLNKITHREAEIQLNDMCIDYGTEAVAAWLMDNGKEAIEWLNQGAA